MLKYAIFAFAILAVASAQATPQINITDARLLYSHNDDQPTLSYQDVSQVCKTGVWIVYTGQNYVGALVEIFPHVGTTCHTPFASTVGSTRLVGPQATYGDPSVTLYAAENFGDTATPFSEKANVLTPVHSLVIIGNNRVQLFQGPDQSGVSICLELPVCQNGVCWAFGLNPDDYDWDITTSTESAKIGCGTKATVFKPRNNKHSTIRAS